MTREVELKLDLSAEVYESILSACMPGGREIIQENTFFDTEKRHLQNRQWALRLRKEEGSFWLTAKGPVEVPNGEIFDRPEIECQVTEEEAERFLRGFRIINSEREPCIMLRELFGDLYVKKIIHFKNRRRYLRYEGLHLELDKMQVENRIFYELEYEGARELNGNCTILVEGVVREAKMELQPFQIE